MVFWTIETARLCMRELQQTDAPFILKLLNDPDCIRFIGDRNVHSIADAEKYLNEGPMLMYQQHGMGLLLVSERETGKPVGMCGLLKRDYLQHPDIGFAFMPLFRGVGYAYESANAVIEFARKNKRVGQISAIVSPDNRLSIALLNKLDLRFSADLELPELGGPTKLFVSQ